MRLDVVAVVAVLFDGRVLREAMRLDVVVSLLAVVVLCQTVAILRH